MQCLLLLFHSSLLVTRIQLMCTGWSMWQGRLLLLYMRNDLSALYSVQVSDDANNTQHILRQ